MVLELARGQEPLEHRGLRLLDLQEQRVPFVAADEQDHPRPGAHAADADDLAGEVDELVAREQLAISSRSVAA